VNISEPKLWDVFDEYMAQFDFPIEWVEAFGKALEKELRKSGATTCERQKVSTNIE